MQSGEYQESFPLKHGDDEYTCSRENTFLYTFAGQLAIYDHVFVVTGEEDDHYNGLYLFNTVPTFEALKEYLLRQEYPVQLNQRQVAQCDIDAFERMSYNDIRSIDSYPEEWDGK